MDPNQDKRLSRQFTQAVTASDLEEVNQLDSRPSTPLSFMEEREKSDEQAVRDIADPVGMKAMFLAAIDKDQDHDGAGKAFAHNRSCILKCRLPVTSKLRCAAWSLIRKWLAYCRVGPLPLAFNVYR